MKDRIYCYFLVCCKCGHVGRGRFIRMVFPIRARDAREAAARGRQHPGVKHDQPDAVLWVEAVTREVYKQTEAEVYRDIYWKGARKNLALIFDRLEREQRPSYNAYPRKAVRGYYQKKIKLQETEIREYIIREYRVAV